MLYVLSVEKVREKRMEMHGSIYGSTRVMQPFAGFLFRDALPLNNSESQINQLPNQA